MNAKELIKAKWVRKRVQLGVFPIVVGTIQAYGPHALIEMVGISQSIVLLGALILVQVYLILARLQFDFRGPS